MLSQNLKDCFDLMADLTNGAVTILSGGGAIPVLMSLSGDYALVKTVDFAAAKAELVAQSDADRQASEAEYKSKLKFPDPNMQARVGQGIDLFEKEFQMVEQQVALVKGQLALVESAKALFQTAPTAPAPAV